MSKPVMQIAKIGVLLLLLCSASAARAAQPMTPAALLKQESDISALPDLHTWSSFLQSSCDRTGSKVSFTLNGTLLPTVFDGCYDGVIPSGPVDHGRVTLPKGLPALVVTVTGKKAWSSGTLFRLDAPASNSLRSAPAPLPSE